MEEYFDDVLFTNLADEQGQSREYASSLHMLKSNRKLSTSAYNMLNYGHFGQDESGNLNLIVSTNKIIPEREYSTHGVQNKEINDLNMKITSEIESHESEKFAEIMRMDQIKPEDVMDSLSLENNRQSVFQSGEGAGMSGSFFFFSHDNKFIIKTLRGSERRVMLGMLDDYIDHIRKTHNRSLLARIYGIFTIKTKFFEPLDIIIMQNTCNPNNKKNDQLTFDLKGSTIGRATKFPKED